MQRQRRPRPPFRGDHGRPSGEHAGPIFEGGGNEPPISYSRAGLLANVPMPAISVSTKAVNKSGPPLALQQMINADHLIVAIMEIPLF